jgi:hypothetical protein
MTAFLRTNVWSCSSSSVTLVIKAGTMSLVTSLQSATSAADASSTLAEARSRCIWFTSMNRKSWSGASMSPHAKYPARFWLRSWLAVCCTATTYPQEASCPSIST